ncbi:hypothetical protein RCH17_003273 [Arthrobacter sp. MP_M7]|nr:hypothetical protein [Arthrobacter sp. MP_M4]MEC5204449.1 hypothetical protein [Arthrobacter sp. MP_M7]
MKTMSHTLDGPRASPRKSVLKPGRSTQIETYHPRHILRVISGQSLAEIAVTLSAGAATGMGPMGAGDLSAGLWQERRQLELLLFRLETQRLHLEAGNLQWLSFTAAEVEGVLERLRFEALARSVESAAIAAEWGLPAQATLLELIGGAPAGTWPEILQDHLDTLRTSLDRLSAAARTNEDTLRGLGVRQAAALSGGGVEDGVTQPADTTQVLDQLTMAGTIEYALAVIGRTAQPVLARYLDVTVD